MPAGVIGWEKAVPTRDTAYTPISDAIRDRHIRRNDIRQALAGLVLGDDPCGRPILFQDGTRLPPFDDSEIDNPRLLSSAASELFRMRRARDQQIPSGIVGEPAWDMLLALYIEDPAGLPISSICYASGVPSSTGLRWIAALTKKGLVDREPHQRDRRVTLVSLTDLGRLMMERSLKAMLRAARS